VDLTGPVEDYLKAVYDIELSESAADASRRCTPVHGASLNSRALRDILNRMYITAWTSAYRPPILPNPITCKDF